MDGCIGGVSYQCTHICDQVEVMCHKLTGPTLFFWQVYEDMPQICVDVPPAYTILEKFVMQCQSQKVVGDDVVKKLPVR